MSRVLACLFLLFAAPSLAHAQQIFESVGSRALGMAGAFVAVADDATAVYWNPAGLAGAGPAGMTMGWTRFRTGDQDRPPRPGPTGRSSTFVSLGTWPIGISYGRLQSTALIPAADGSTMAETLRTSQFGATILQSVTQGLIVGSTLKYVRGTVASGPATATSVADAIDAAIRADGRSSGRFDFDAGLMVDMDLIRIGFTVRNVREPSFPGIAGTAIKLQRQSRVGLAVLPASGLTFALDADLDTVDLRDGLRRMIALGGEERLGTRFAVRGGIRWSVEGPRRMVEAVGVSVALRPSFWVDGHFTHGDLDADRGLGLAMRAGWK